MLKILCQIVSYRWNLKAHFEFRKVYNTQIIKRIQISNVTSRNSVQSYVLYVESSVSAMPVSKAYKHVDRVSNWLTVK